MLLGGSEAGKVPSRPLSSSLCNFLSAFTACFGSSACLSVGAGLNLSDMMFLVCEATLFGTNRFRARNCLFPSNWNNASPNRLPDEGSATQGMSDFDALFSQPTESLLEVSFPNFSQRLRGQA